MRRSAVLAVLAVLLPPAARAQEAPPRPTLQATRLPAPPTLDGHITAEEWSAAARVDTFTQLEPKEGAPESEKTEVRIGYDDENLYIGARCWDSEASAIVANVLSRDGDMAYDDTIEVILDTFLDRQSGFLFSVNPLGAQTDAIVRHEGEEVNVDWDGVWQSVATRDAEGWTAEIAIPFKSLRFPKAAEQTWGMNIGRFIARKREQSFWTPLSRSYGFWARYKVSRFGEIAGLQGVTQGSRYQLRPYLVGGTREDHGSYRSIGSDDFDAGVDLKMQITSNLVGDVTVNTDFAEAESDAQQVNITRFSLFFPEKRGFFLEGADLFYFGERPEPYKSPEFQFFFSRRIGLSEDGIEEIPILAGAKLAGRVGSGIGLGFLSITTDETGLIDSQGRTFTQPRTTYSVLRLKKNVFQSSSIGLLALDKSASGDGDGDNEGAGMDWDFTLSESLKVGGFVARTRTPGLDGKDWAAYSDLFYDSKLWRVRAAYADIGDDFNPEMGFLTRNGVRRGRTALTRNFYPEGPHVRQWFLVHYMDYVTDQEGEIETRLHWLEASVFFQSSAGLAFKIYDQLEGLKVPFEISPGVVIPVGDYRFRSVFAGFQTDYSKPYGGVGRVLAGEFYDGDILQLFGGLILRPRPGLQTILTWERTDVDLPAGSFVRDLAAAIVAWSFRPGLSLVAQNQWSREDNFRGKLVLNWEYRKGSNLYVIYDDTRDLTDQLAPPRDRPLPDYRRFVAKVSYLFDF